MYQWQPVLKNGTAVSDAVDIPAAVERTRDLLDSAVPAVNDFYAPVSASAGFLYSRNFGAEYRNEFTVDDVIALNANGKHVPALVMRRLFADDETRDAVAMYLADIPGGLRLEDAGEEDFAAMNVFYRYVRDRFIEPGQAYTGRWEEPGQLVARIRPNVFPVMDKSVAKFLDFNKTRNAPAAWFVYQQVLRDAEVRGELLRIREEASVDVSSEPDLVLLHSAVSATLRMRAVEAKVKKREAKMAKKLAKKQSKKKSKHSGK